jgi:hypothetical protein
MVIDIANRTSSATHELTLLTLLTLYTAEDISADSSAVLRAVLLC